MRSASVSPSTSSSTKARIAIRVFHSVNRADVGMIEGRKHARLAFEPRQPIGITGEELRQDLDRDIATELRVARAIDLAHAARRPAGT